jgi:hypothetical protein
MPGIHAIMMQGRVKKGTLALFNFCVEGLTGFAFT